MNKQSIEAARDADLRLSQHAMQRAARRAHELAAQTGTAIVVWDRWLWVFRSVGCRMARKSE